MTSKITHKQKTYIIGFLIGWLTFRGVLKIYDKNYIDLCLDIIPGIVACCYWLYFEYILMREVDKNAGY